MSYYHYVQLTTLMWCLCAGNPYWMGRHSTVDLFVLTSLDQPISKLKILTLFYKNKLRGGQLHRHFPYISFPWSVLWWRFLLLSYSGNPYWKGRLSTGVLLLLISLDQLLLLLKMFVFKIFFCKTTYLRRRSIVLTISLWLVFHGQCYDGVSSIFLKVSDYSGNPYWRGRPSTIDLLVLTSLDQPLLLLQKYLTFF